MKNHYRWAGAALYVAALFYVSATPTWAAEYTIIDLGENVVPTGINNKGQVFGQAYFDVPSDPLFLYSSFDSRHHAFLYNGGRLIDLLPYYKKSIALGNNNKGEVVGDADVVLDRGVAGAVAFMCGFVYINRDDVTCLSVGEAPGYRYGFVTNSSAVDINDKGEVMGYRNDLRV